MMLDPTLRSTRLEGSVPPRVHIEHGDNIAELLAKSYQFGADFEPMNSTDCGRAVASLLRAA